jgi:hypothetical protein
VFLLAPRFRLVPCRLAIVTSNPSLYIYTDINILRQCQALVYIYLHHSPLQFYLVDVLAIAPSVQGKSDGSTRSDRRAFLTDIYPSLFPLLLPSFLISQIFSVSSGFGGESFPLNHNLPDRLVFCIRGYPIRISHRLPTILFEYSRGFSRSLQVHARIVLLVYSNWL